MRARFLSKMRTTFQKIKEQQNLRSISLMRRITYLQKCGSCVLSIPVLSIPKLNVTQTRRLVRKCDSSREIGITERVSEKGQLTSLQHCPSPRRCCSTSRRASVDENKRVQRVIYFFWYMRDSSSYLIFYMLLVMTASQVRHATMCALILILY